ncbi:MAG: hypothetical protein PHI31_02160 [Desulfuromonadaceae bacterium]|nr:hypothetical protein [Desulfuromonadaceae bacterium]
MFVHCSEMPIVTQVGFRFWDPARDVQVTDGLEVTARTVSTFSQTFKAFKTTSGNYAFHGLPGLHDVEYPEEFPAGPPARTRAKLIIEVKDIQRNFLPAAFLFDEELPLAYGGIYRSSVFEGMYPSVPPDSGSPLFYLLSAPTRQPMPGMAVVRCQLKDYDTDRPASHALIEIGVNGKKWFGMADKDGAAAIYFPYPPIDAAYSGTASPPVSISRSLRSRKWPLSIRIAYSPDSVELLAKEAIPELRSILRQHPAYIWPQDPAGPLVTAAVFDMDGELAYGHEVVLRTGTKSELYLQSVPTSP